MKQWSGVLALLLLPLLLAGATFTHGGYVVVDDDPQFGVPGSTFTTIQAAEDSGATYIVVRPGTYTETVVIDTPNVTVEFQGATIPNNGESTSITIAADGITLKGDYCITGAHSGAIDGMDDWRGVGIRVLASYATIDGLCTRNLPSFSVLVKGEGNPSYNTVRNCDLQNVATSAFPEQYAPYAILLMGEVHHNDIHDCLITGHSQGVGLWYRPSYNRIHHNRLINNYGWIVSGGGYGSRSAFEDYGEGLPNVGNQFAFNEVDGSTGAGFELADVLEDTQVTNNTIRNVMSSAFATHGSEGDKARNVLIADNVIYGDGDDATNWFSGSGRITGNTFIGYTNNATLCTIYLHGDALGDVTIDSNTFEGGGCVLRTAAPNGTLWITNNRFNGVDRNTLWFDGQASDNTVIEGNVFSGVAGRAVSANDTAVTVRNNQIEGVVAVGAGSIVEGNTIRTSAVDFISVYPQDNSIYRYNRFISDRPSWAEWDANGLLLERNYAEMLNGSPAPLFSCNAQSMCTGNWTSGQVPPP